jgi:tetratricopeptide (TPR) repeat protein
LTENAEQIKEEVLKRGNDYYEKSLGEFKNEEYEKALGTLNKAFAFNSLNIQFYLLRCEAFIQLCDFKSALITINKLLSILAIYTTEDDVQYDDLRRELLDKIIFCYFMIGQTYFDSCLYLDACEAFNKAAELKPDSLLFKVKRLGGIF